MKNLKNINFKNKKTIILFVSLILFIFLTYNIFNNKIAFIDSYIEGIILSIRNDKLTDVMTIITNISSAYALIVITVLLLILINELARHLIAWSSYHPRLFDERKHKLLH